MFLEASMVCCLISWKCAGWHRWVIVSLSSLFPSANVRRVKCQRGQEKSKATLPPLFSLSPSLPFSSASSSSSFYYYYYSSSFSGKRQIESECQQKCRNGSLLSHPAVLVITLCVTGFTVWKKTTTAQSLHRPPHFGCWILDSGNWYAINIVNYTFFETERTLLRILQSVQW